MARRYALVEAPSILGLKPTGVERLPARLMELGIAERLGARIAARLEPPPYPAQRDAQTLTLNASAIASWSPILADAVERVLDRGEFPVVLGGDCSILLGSALALKRRGRYGLLFIDAHADFYQPEVNPNGEAASMELAFATGHGPRLLCDLEGRGPLLRSEDVVAFGIRDHDEQRRYKSQPLPGDLLEIDLPTIRRDGVSRAIASAIDRVARADLDGFFIHLDADGFADDVMPAVDYRVPGGLTWDEGRALLAAALSSGRAVGMEVTIYNPSLDTDGAAGRGLADAIVGGLTR